MDFASYSTKLCTLASRMLACSIVFGLLCSFGLHALQIKHIHALEYIGGHHEHTTEGSGETVFLGEYLHVSEKKVSFMALLAVLMQIYPGVFLVSFIPLFLSGVYSFLGTYTYRNRNLYRQFSYLVQILKQGVIHSKAF